MHFQDMLRDEWHGGQLMAFSGLDGPTDFESCLTARTAFDAPGLEIRLPAVCRLWFPEDTGRRNIVAGDWLCLGEDLQAIRAVFLDTHHLLVQGPCRLERAEPGIAFLQRGDRALIGSDAHFNDALLESDLEEVLLARRRWLASLSLPEGLSAAGRSTLLKALSIMKTQVYSPEGRIRHRWTTPDRWPHRRMWLWDSAFHAIGWRHIDPTLARDAILAVLDMQAPDGFIAHEMGPRSASEITQPPVLALGARLVHQTDPEPDWIDAIYPGLCRYVEWDMNNRDGDGSGLPEWMIEGNPHCRSGESGMDNSPRFDTATRMDAVDFSSFLALECEILSEFAALLGREEESAEWSRRRNSLCSLISSRLWSQEARFFVDYDIDRQARSPVLASAGFLPLICGAATPEQAAALAGHLEDPEMFGTPLPVSSIAVRDREHYSKDMWRGPVWINLNWLIALGLERYGFREAATGLRRRTMEEIEGRCREYGSIFEFYDDRREVGPPELLRKGSCDPGTSPFRQVLHDYGWSATLYADWAFQSAKGEI